MEYELAKQLKDAGFPQGEKGNMLAHPDWEKKPKHEWGETNAYNPTLSELIEACGDKFSTLWRTPEGIDDEQSWVANVYFDYQTNDALRGSFGSTPEEAVERLWLALNKK